MSKPIAVCYYESDIDHALAHREHIRAVLPLTLKCLAKAKHFGLPYEEGVYSDWDQARTVVRTDKGRCILVETMRAMHLSMPEQEMITDVFNRVVVSAIRFWFMLGANGPWCLATQSGLQVYPSRQEAYSALAPHVLRQRVSHKQGVVFSSNRIFSMMQSVFVRFIGKRRKIILIGANKDMFGLKAQIEKYDPTVSWAICEYPQSILRAYAYLVRNILHVFSNRRHFSIMVIPTETVGEGAGLASDQTDPIIRCALKAAEELLEHNMRMMRGSEKAFDNIVNQINPRLFLSAEISRMTEWMLAWSCGKKKIKRVIVGRNGQVPTSSALAKTACNEYFLTRHPFDFFDEAFVWSPPAFEHACSAVSESGNHIIRTVNAVPVSDHARRDVKRRKVLLADSYAAWGFPHAWILQTANEFVSSARRVSSVMEEMAETNFIIRAKLKFDADLSDLVALIEPGANTEIKIRGVPFSEELANTDLLISFHSTTIFEALFARCPVLLFGGTSRFRYLEARMTPPTEVSRAAVYAIDNEADLPEMIRSILTHHAGKPLTDDEIAKYCHLDGAPSIPDLAQELVANL